MSSAAPRILGRTSNMALSGLQSSNPGWIVGWWQVFVVLVVLCCVVCCYGCCCLYLILPASAFVQLHTAGCQWMDVFRQIWPSANHQSPQCSLWGLTTADPAANVFMFWTNWAEMGVALLYWRGAHLPDWSAYSSISFDLTAMYAVCMHSTVDESMSCVSLHDLVCAPHHILWLVANPHWPPSTVA